MITIEVQDREVLDVLRQLQARLDDLSPVMEAIGQRLEERISMRFETESDPSGAAWATWKTATEGKKRRQKGDRPRFHLQPYP
jgi:phage gpG-like protein